MKWFLPIAAALAAAALAVAGASAKAKVSCVGGPISLGDDIPADVRERPRGILAEWTGAGDGLIQCGTDIVAIDVWEHAYGIAVDPSDPTGNTFRGRAQIVIEFTGAGVRVPFKGTVRGVWDDTDIVHVIRATSPGGARIELRQTAVIDLDADTLDLDVDQGFFDVFTDWLE